MICFPRVSYENGDTSYFVQNPTTLFLPISVGDDNGDREPDYNEIGQFLQAVGAYTYDVTLDAYINSAVIGRGMRDQKSAEMVRIMMKSRSFDLCQAFSFDMVNTGFSGCVHSGSNFVSSAKKIENSFKKAADKIVTQIMEHVD